MKISVIQMKVSADAPEYNYLHAEELIKKAAADETDVIVLPEAWNTGYFPKGNIHALADRSGERTKALLSSLSKEYKVNIIGGSVTQEKDGRHFNTCFVYDRNGELTGEYHKLHLFSPMKEQLYYERGDSFCVFTADGVKCAVAVCYDIRFPEYIRRLAFEGIKILFVPMAWPSERLSQMNILMRARAVENQIFTVSCNSASVYDGTVFGGGSVASDPFGNELIKGSEGEEILTFSADTSVLDRLKDTMNVLNDRIEGLY